MSPLTKVLRLYLPDGWSGREVAREAEKAGVKLSPAAANNYLNGKVPAQPKLATLEAFAKVFRIDVNILVRAAGLPDVKERYVGPDESRLLDTRERDAIDEMIAVLLRAKRDQASQSKSNVRHLDQLVAKRHERGGRPPHPSEQESDDEVFPTPTEIVDEDLTKDQAAREGRSVGRQIREAHDKSAEAPDPEGPEYGA